ncbi:MAG: DUF58 domain-containing protein [Planctomycetota bacterium]|nr:DUF58 domain-containing protein [Planctomycetota bacterium]
MFGRRNVSVTAEGWYFLLVVLFIVVAAVMREVNLLIILAGMLLGPWLFHWRMVVSSLRKLEVQRDVPGVVCAMQPFRVDITVHNHRQRMGSWCLTVEDRVRRLDHSRQRQVPVEILIPYVAAGTSSSASYHWMIDRRGLYELPALQVRTRFPFGLLQARHRHRVEHTVRVGPPVGELTTAWRSLLETNRSGGDQAQPRQGRSDGDYYALRPWRSGDNRRWIHWRTTARIGQPAVKQFEQQHQQQLVVLLDLFDHGTEHEADPLHVELAASMALTVIQDAFQRDAGQLVVALAGESVHHWSAHPSRTMVEEIVSCLATLEAGEGLSPRTWKELHDRIRQGSRPVVISTRSREEAGLSPPGDQITWIDCRTEEIWQYFRLQRPQSTRQDDRHPHNDGDIS